MVKWEDVHAIYSTVKEKEFFFHEGRNHESQGCV